jgi:hypothetical protein
VAAWSDRKIARRCGVDRKTVSALRPGLSAEVPQIDRVITGQEHDARRLVTRGGKTYEQNTAAIGRAPGGGFSCRDRCPMGTTG